MTRLLLGIGTAAAIGVALAGSVAAAAPPPLPNLVRNGSFEHPRVRVGSSFPFASIPGWRLAFGSAIEIQNPGASAAAVGDQLVELDSNASSGISQLIPTRPNRLYRLQFFFDPAPERRLPRTSSPSDGTGGWSPRSPPTARASRAPTGTCTR